MYDDLTIYKKYQSGDKGAYGDAFKTYEPLINSAVTQYKGTGLPEDALRMEAKKIIMASLKTYNPDMGNMTAHIQNNMKSMFRETNKASQIYIPDARAPLYRKFKDMQDNMYAELKRHPTDSELADALKIGVKDVRRLAKETGASIVADSNFEQDDYAANTAEDEKSLMSAVRRSISDPTDQKVWDMAMRGKATNEAIGGELGITEGAVRQRKSKLIDKIKGMA